MKDKNMFSSYVYDVFTKTEDSIRKIAWKKLSHSPSHPRLISAKQLFGPLKQATWEEIKKHR